MRTVPHAERPNYACQKPACQSLRRKDRYLSTFAGLESLRDDWPNKERDREGWHNNKTCHHQDSDKEAVTGFADGSHLQNNLSFISLQPGTISVQYGFMVACLIRRHKRSRRQTGFAVVKTGVIFFERTGHQHSRTQLILILSELNDLNRTSRLRSK